MTANNLRRTRTDLEYLADVADRPAEWRSAVDGADDADRNERLRAHGWFTSDDRLTGDGARLAATVDVLRRRDVFDLSVRAVGGLPNFVDIATACPPEDVVAYFAGVRTLANLVDEARHQADTQDVEYDHDGTFAPHFADFDPRNGRVEMRFESKATAAEFFREWCPDRYDAERKHDERFASNRNPRRLVVGGLV